MAGRLLGAPVAAVSLTRSFVHTLTASERDPKLVRALIGMAHDPGYRVVAVKPA